MTSGIGGLLFSTGIDNLKILPFEIIETIWMLLRPICKHESQRQTRSPPTLKTRDGDGACRQVQYSTAQYSANAAESWRTAAKSWKRRGVVDFGGRHVP
jgi:hypothetical protein